MKELQKLQNIQNSAITTPFEALQKGGLDMANYSKTLKIDGSKVHIQNPGQNVVTRQQLLKVKQEKVDAAKGKEK